MHLLQRLLLNVIFWLMVGVPLAARATVAEVPLHEFLPYPSLELRCVQDEQALEIPIPDRWKLKSASLSLHYTVSSALISRTSLMVVKVNGTPVAQTKLVPISESDRFKVELPAKLLQPGYNKLSFYVSQHYLDKECEQPCASSLWTSIKLETSDITFDYELKPVPMQLASLSGFTFDPKLFPAGKVHLAFNTADEQAANLAAVVASGVARRFDYRKVTFTVSDLLEPGRDNVVIGNEAFIQKLLGAGAPKSSSPGKGGYLKILPMPAEGGAIDDRHALVVVSGATVEEVKLAAETLGNLSIAYPGSDELKAVGFSLPNIQAYSGRSVLSADKLYDFKTLNLPTRTMAGMNPLASSIDFRLPADFLIKQNRSAEVVLNFAYGAGMRSDSSLNVLVNNVAVRAIPLQNTEGGFYEKYRLDIPTYVFQPGSNRITFTPELHLTAKECDLLQPGNLFLTIFDNSTLKFPYMPHFVEMPRLELFMLNGFPFTRWPDGFEGSIYIARPTLDALAAAMNVVGLMTQKNGFPLLNLGLTFKPPKNPNGDLIVLGDVFSLPQDIAAGSPLRPGKTSLVPYPIIRNWQNESSFSYSEQISRMGSDRGLLVEFESPLQPGRSVLLLAAEDQKDLLQLSENLLNPEVQGQIGGDLVLFEFGGEKPKVTAVSVGKKYVTGKGGEIGWLDSSLDRLDSAMYAHPYIFYGLLALLVGALSWVLFILIRRYRKRRLATVAGTRK